MSTLTTTRIREHASKLGMTHLTDTISELVARAEADQMGYLDFVDLLLGEELGIREGRRFRNALKLSGLPHHKTLDEFDFTFQPDLEPRKIRDLATLEFIERHAGRIGAGDAQHRSSAVVVGTGLRLPHGKAIRVIEGPPLTLDDPIGGMDDRSTHYAALRPVNRRSFGHVPIRRRRLPSLGARTSGCHNKD